MPPTPRGKELNMATEAKTKTAGSTKATPKTKAKSKRKVAAKKTAARKSTAKKVQQKRVSRKASADFSTRAQEAGRNAFLAGLGFYGKAFDQIQEQFNTLQDQLEERREKASDLYEDLVKRGEKLEADAKDAIELPDFKLDSLADRKKLDKQLKKVKTRFNDLKTSAGFKTAA